jgi:acyl carrier protein
VSREPAIVNVRVEKLISIICIRSDRSMGINQSITVRDQVREFVQNLASAKGISSFTDQEALLESGILDSLSIFRLVAFLEDTFRIKISDQEITNENLKTVEIIEQLVLSKQGK